jgi:chitosanase
MPVTLLQKRTAQAIVNIFETGHVHGDYARVTVHPQDPGHLTYGRSQLTLASGNLYLLLRAYCSAEEAAGAGAITPYLERLAQADTTLDGDLQLREALRRAGDDPVMCELQDAFFDRVFWAPAAGAAASLGLETALGVTVVYDSAVHGSWIAMRDRTRSVVGEPRALGEKGWVQRYVETRQGWLAAHANALLRRTTYRMDAFLTLIERGAWDLPLPLRVRGVEITEEGLLPAPVLASAATDRILRLQTPHLAGEDVRQVQEALKTYGHAVEVDGVYGVLTQRFIRDFQRTHGLTADGIVGPATRLALGL